MMAHAGKTLSQQAVAALDEARRKAQNPPHANRGGSSGQTTDFQTENQAPNGQKPAVCASKCPHLRTSGRRARKPHQPWKNGWKHRGFDWLTITLPNGRNRKGERRRADPSEVAEAAACRASNASKLCNASTMRTRWAEKRPARHGMPLPLGRAGRVAHAEGRGRNGRLQGGPALRGLADGRRAAGHGEGLSCQQHAEP